MTFKKIGFILLVYGFFMLGVNIFFNESNVNIILIVFLGSESNLSVKDVFKWS